MVKDLFGNSKLIVNKSTTFTSKALIFDCFLLISEVSNWCTI